MVRTSASINRMQRAKGKQSSAGDRCGLQRYLLMRYPRRQNRLPKRNFSKCFERILQDDKLRKEAAQRKILKTQPLSRHYLSIACIRELERRLPKLALILLTFAHHRTQSLESGHLGWLGIANFGMIELKDSFERARQHNIGLSGFVPGVRRSRHCGEMSV